MSTATETTAGDLFTPTVEGTPPEPLLMTPGAPAARRAGCWCPAWLNTYGAGVRTGYGTAEEGTFLAHPACRLHGAL